MRPIETLPQTYVRLSEPTHQRYAGPNLGDAPLLPRPRTIVFARIHRAVWLVGTLLFSSATLIAEPIQTHVVCRENIGQAQREDLTNKLRKITGWPDLRFDRGCNLRLGNKAPVGGSPTARALLDQAASGANFIVLEDASRRAEVAFSRVIDGKWKGESSVSPAAFVIQIDFADFRHVMGDSKALQAFDVGWALLHELDHVVNNSVDAHSLGDAGVCESHINQMRRECDLPERAEYFFTYLPLADVAFNTKWVRLAFEQSSERASKKNRYWVLWDAQLVGGINEPAQVVAMK